MLNMPMPDRSLKSFSSCRPFQTMIAMTAAHNGMSESEIDTLMHEDTRPAAVACPHCGKPMPYHPVMVDGEFFCWRPFPGPCDNPDCIAIEAQRKRDAEMRERLNRLDEQMHMAGIPLMYRNATLRDYRTDGNPSLENAKAAVRSLIDRLATEKPGPRGLLICGPVGTGKSHLACAAVRGAILQGRYARYTSAGRLLEMLKASYSGGDSEEITKASCNATLLVLDDLCKEHGSGWSFEKLQEIVDVRCSNGRPTVYTTNLLPDDLHRRISEIGGSDIANALMSRVRNTSDIITVVAEDYRMREARA